MVEIRVEYRGDLHCEATHGPSGATLVTDAPADNMGKGAAFSPTDLVATAIGTCMLTIMGIAARKHGLDLTGATAAVKKEMVTGAARRIGCLAVEIRVPRPTSAEARQILEEAAHGCPICRSLHPEVRVPVTFVWG